MSSTPYRSAAAIVNQRPDSAVITGVNLHMLLEAVIERDAVETLSELTDDLVQSTLGGVICHSSPVKISALA